MPPRKKQTTLHSHFSQSSPASSLTRRSTRASASAPRSSQRSQRARHASDDSEGSVGLEAVQLSLAPVSSPTKKRRVAVSDGEDDDYHASDSDSDIVPLPSYRPVTTYKRNRTSLNSNPEAIRPARSDSDEEEEEEEEHEEHEEEDVVFVPTPKPKRARPSRAKAPVSASTSGQTEEQERRSASAALGATASPEESGSPNKGRARTRSGRVPPPASTSPTRSTRSTRSQARIVPQPKMARRIIDFIELPTLSEDVKAQYTLLYDRPPPTHPLPTLSEDVKAQYTLLYDRPPPTHKRRAPITAEYVESSAESDADDEGEPARASVKRKAPATQGKGKEKETSRSKDKGKGRSKDTDKRRSKDTDKRRSKDGKRRSKDKGKRRAKDRDDRRKKRRRRDPDDDDDPDAETEEERDFAAELEMDEPERFQSKTRLRQRGETDHQRRLRKLRNQRLGIVESTTSESSQDDSDSDSDASTVSDGTSGFITDSGESTAARVALPAEFSMDISQTPEYKFKVVYQFFVLLVIEGKRVLPLKGENASYFNPYIMDLRSRMNGFKKGSVASQIWKPDYSKALEKYPVFKVTPLKNPKSFCNACNRHKQNCRNHVTLGGVPYNHRTFEPEEESDNDDDSSSDSDSSGAHSDKYGLPTQFNMGNHCLERSQLFHAFAHWEFMLYSRVRRHYRDLLRALHKPVPEDLEASSSETDPDSDPEEQRARRANRDRRRAQTRQRIARLKSKGPLPHEYKSVDRVTEWMDKRGFQTKEYRRIKELEDKSQRLEEGV